MRRAVLEFSGDFCLQPAPGDPVIGYQIPLPHQEGTPPPVFFLKFLCKGEMVVVEYSYQEDSNCIMVRSENVDGEVDLAAVADYLSNGLPKELESYLTCLADKIVGEAPVYTS